MCQHLVFLFFIVPGTAFEKGKQEHQNKEMKDQHVQNCFFTLIEMKKMKKKVGSVKHMFELDISAGRLFAFLSSARNPVLWNA